jgi:hypothetical protein
MRPRLFVEEAARADLADAFRWYEGQRAGLGSEFLAAVAVVFERIEENPMGYPITRGTTVAFCCGASPTASSMLLTRIWWQSRRSCTVDETRGGGKSGVDA